MFLCQSFFLDPLPLVEHPLDTHASVALQWMRIPVTQLPPKSCVFLPKKKPSKLRVGINFHGATVVIYIYSTQIQCFQHPLHFRIPSLISDVSGCYFFSFLGKWKRRLDGRLNKPLPSHSSESINLKTTIFMVLLVASGITWNVSSTEKYFLQE